MDSMSANESHIEDSLVPKTVVKWRHAIWQLVATFVAQSIVMQGGINLTFNAILLPQLRNSTSDILIDDGQASWIASIMTLFLPVGSLAIGPIMGKYGPKFVCLISGIPFFFSWMLFAFSTKVYHLYIARSLTGLGAGLSNVALVYVSEICHPQFRATFLGLNSAMVSFGILLTAVLGLWCSWRAMAIIFAVLTLLSTIGMALMPESPYWLVAFYEEVPLERIMKSLRWLHTNKKIYNQQLQEIIKSKHDSVSLSETEGIGNKIKENLKMLKDPTVYKPTLILLILFIFQQLSGAYVTIVYAVDVLKEIGGHFGHGINEYVALVFLGVIRFVIAIISSLISKRVGRRPLLSISCLGMFFSCLCVSVYIIYFKSISTDLIALVFHLSFICFASLGFLVIPWSLLGELLPVTVKGSIGGSTITTIVTLMMFIVVKTFPELMNSLKIEYIFLIFAIDNLLATCFVYWFLPETLNKTFAEIEKCFK